MSVKAMQVDGYSFVFPSLAGGIIVPSYVIKPDGARLDLVTGKENDLYSVDLCTLLSINVSVNKMLSTNRQEDVLQGGMKLFPVVFALQFNKKLFGNMPAAMKALHIAFNHISRAEIIQLLRLRLVGKCPPWLTEESVRKHWLQDCDVCAANRPRAPLSKHEEKVIEEIGDLVAVDFWFPYGDKKLSDEESKEWVASNGDRVVGEFYDHFSGYGFNFSFPSTGSLVPLYRAIIAHFKRYGHTIKMFQVDKQLISAAAIQFLALEHIPEPDVAAPGEHATNGVIENQNHQTKDKTRILLHDLKQKFLWNYAAQHAAMGNNLFRPSNNDPSRSRHTVFTGKEVDISRMLMFPFGAKVWVYSQHEGKAQCDRDRRIEMIVVASALNHSGCIVCYNPETKLTSTTRSFAVMDELPIDESDQVSAILSEGDRPMLPLLVNGKIVEKKSPDDLLEMVEVQPGEESESDQDDLEGLVRKRKYGGSKFVAPLAPAIRPVTALPVPVPANVPVPVPFDKDNWKDRRAKFAKRVKSAPIRPGSRPLKPSADTQISEGARVAMKPVEQISEGEIMSAIVEPVQPISEGETLPAVVDEARVTLAAAGDGARPQRVPIDVEADRRMKARMNVMKQTQPAAVCPPSTTQGRGGKPFKSKKKGDFVKSTVQRIINHYGSREALRSALGQASAMNATVDGTHDQQRYSITESLAIAFSIVVNNHSGEKLPLSLLVPPKSLKQAKMRDDWEYWKAAIRAEYEKLVANKTFEIVGDRPPPGHVPLHTKFVFATKTDVVTGEPLKATARDVARGDMQRKGTYGETYAPTANAATHHMALAVGANQDLEIGSGDIGGAFLIPDLDEELYIWLDPDMTGLDHRVCAKLNKTLYGLKQSAHMFNIKFAKHLISKGFVQSCHDPCLFRFSRGKSFTIVTLHVDDFIYMSPTVWEQNAFKLMMKEGFEVVTFHDEISQFYGASIVRDRSKHTLKVAQTAYAREIVETFLPEDAPIADTPSRSSNLSTTSDLSPGSVDLLRKIVGKLTFLTRTRPDIQFYVNSIARCQVAPTMWDIESALTIVRYVKGTLDLGLVFSGSDGVVLCGHVDASFRAHDDCKSHSGGCFSIGRDSGSFFSFSMKQPIVTLSAAEAEFVAACEAAREILWMRGILHDMGYPQMESSILFEDNTACISLATSQGKHDRMKHIDVRYHFLKEQVKQGTVQIVHIPGTEQRADILTKDICVADIFLTHQPKLLGTRF